MLRRLGRSPGVLGLRQYSKSPLSVAFTSGDQEDLAARYRNQKNPLVPSIANLDVRWLKLDAGQQDDIVAYLEDKMRGPWHEMTLEDKKAAHYVWYGNWGPRAATKDSASIYSYLAAILGITALSIGGYRLATYHSEEEVQGLKY